MDRFRFLCIYNVIPYHKPCIHCWFWENSRTACSGPGTIKLEKFLDTKYGMQIRKFRILIGWAGKFSGWEEFWSFMALGPGLCCILKVTCFSDFNNHWMHFKILLISSSSTVFSAICLKIDRYSMKKKQTNKKTYCQLYYNVEDKQYLKFYPHSVFASFALNFILIIHMTSHGNTHHL